jgi:C1A family cysteine protease
MLNTICKALAGAGISCSTSDVEGGVQTRFMEHVANYGISYGTQEEYDFRMTLFAKRDAAYNEINEDPENTFVVAHNMFSTLTEDEAKKWMGRKPTHLANSTLEVEEINAIEAAEVDWRVKGAVNPVQNQAQCGSCWAFSSTAALEGAHFIKSGELLKLSEQQFVDCDKTSSGCNGGLEIWAFNYAEKNAIETEKTYPYVGKDTTCTSKKASGVVNAVSHKAVKAKSVSALKSAVQAGPTCVSVDAANNYFQGYSGGILNTTKCGHNLDHAVTAVGYGSANGQEYVIVRNSWTASWGEEGYIRMSLDVTGDGVCGVLLDNNTVKSD